MGFFDIFKSVKYPNNSKMDSPNSAPISSTEYTAMRTKEIENLEHKYNLSSMDGILSIAVPTQKAISTASLPNATGTIEYYLSLKGSGYEKDGKFELALACYKKMNELMPFSATVYGIERYMRYPRLLRKLRRFNEARTIEMEIYELFNTSLAEILKATPQKKELFVSQMLFVEHSRSQANKLYADHVLEQQDERIKRIDRYHYEWLFENMPELCPQSFNAYRRMKSTNSEKYQKLAGIIRNSNGLPALP